MLHQHSTTALIWASEKGSYATVKALLNAGANAVHTTTVNACNIIVFLFAPLTLASSFQNNQTPLSLAKDELMKRLIRTYLTGAGKGQ